MSIIDEYGSEFPRGSRVDGFSIAAYDRDSIMDVELTVSPLHDASELDTGEAHASSDDESEPDSSNDQTGDRPEIATNIRDSLTLSNFRENIGVIRESLSTIFKPYESSLPRRSSLRHRRSSYDDGGHEDSERGSSQANEEERGTEGNTLIAKDNNNNNNDDDDDAEAKKRQEHDEQRSGNIFDGCSKCVKKIASYDFSYDVNYPLTFCCGDDVEDLCKIPQTGGDACCGSDQAYTSDVSASYLCCCCPVCSIAWGFANAIPCLCTCTGVSCTVCWRFFWPECESCFPWGGNNYDSLEKVYESTQKALHFCCLPAYLPCACIGGCTLFGCGAAALIAGATCALGASSIILPTYLVSNLMRPLLWCHMCDCFCNNDDGVCDKYLSQFFDESGQKICCSRTGTCCENYELYKSERTWDDFLYCWPLYDGYNSGCRTQLGVVSTAPILVPLAVAAIPVGIVLAGAGAAIFGGLGCMYYSLIMPVAYCYTQAFGDLPYFNICTCIECEESECEEVYPWNDENCCACRECGEDSEDYCDPVLYCFVVCWHDVFAPLLTCEKCTFNSFRECFLGAPIYTIDQYKKNPPIDSMTSKLNWISILKGCIHPVQMMLSTMPQYSYVNNFLDTAMPSDGCCCVKVGTCAAMICSVVSAPVIIPACYFGEWCYRKCCFCFFTDQVWATLQGNTYNDDWGLLTEDKISLTEDKIEKASDAHWLYGTPLAIACNKKSYSSENIRYFMQLQPDSANIQGSDRLIPLMHLLTHDKSKPKDISAVAKHTKECKECLEYALQKKKIKLKLTKIPYVKSVKSSHEIQLIKKIQDLEGTTDQNAQKKKAQHENSLKKVKATREEDEKKYRDFVDGVNENNEKKYEANKKRIRSVVEYDLPLTPDRGNSWFFLLSSEEFDKEAQLSIVKDVFENNPTQRLELCNSRDERGRRAIDIAARDVAAIMKKYVLFFSRYEVRVQAAIHKSKTAACYFAEDNDKEEDDENRRVCIKFMKIEEQFEKEIRARLDCDFDNDHVIEVIDMKGGKKEEFWTEVIQLERELNALKASRVSIKGDMRSNAVPLHLETFKENKKKVDLELSRMRKRVQFYDDICEQALVTAGNTVTETERGTKTAILASQKAISHINEMRWVLNRASSSDNSIIHVEHNIGYDRPVWMKGQSYYDRLDELATNGPSSPLSSADSEVGREVEGEDLDRVPITVLQDENNDAIRADPASLFHLLMTDDDGVAFEKPPSFPNGWTFNQLSSGYSRIRSAGDAVPDFNLYTPSLRSKRLSPKSIASEFKEIPKYTSVYHGEAIAPDSIDATDVKEKDRKMHSLQKEVFQGFGLYSRVNLNEIYDSRKQPWFNTAGALMKPSSLRAVDKNYCGRRLGVDNIPGSDGRCGPDDGPQCSDCQRTSRIRSILSQDAMPSSLKSHLLNRIDAKEEFTTLLPSCPLLEFDDYMRYEVYIGDWQQNYKHGYGIHLLVDDSLSRLYACPDATVLVGKFEDDFFVSGTKYTCAFHKLVSSVALETFFHPELGAGANTNNMDSQVDVEALLRAVSINVVHFHIEEQYRSALTISHRKSSPRDKISTTLDYHNGRFKNDSDYPVRLGRDLYHPKATPHDTYYQYGAHLFYCGRWLNIGGIYQRCGPLRGPQCRSCCSFQKDQAAQSLVNQEDRSVYLLETGITGKNSEELNFYCGHIYFDTLPDTMETIDEKNKNQTESSYTILSDGHVSTLSPAQILEQADARGSDDNRTFVRKQYLCWSVAHVSRSPNSNGIIFRQCEACQTFSHEYGSSLIPRSDDEDARKDAVTAPVVVCGTVQEINFVKSVQSDIFMIGELELHLPQMLGAKLLNRVSFHRGSIHYPSSEIFVGQFMNDFKDSYKCILTEPNGNTLDSDEVIHDGEGSKYTWNNHAIYIYHDKVRHLNYLAIDVVDEEVLESTADEDNPLWLQHQYDVGVRIDWGSYKGHRWYLSAGSQFGIGGCKYICRVQNIDEMTKTMCLIVENLADDTSEEYMLTKEDIQQKGYIGRERSQYGLSPSLDHPPELSVIAADFCPLVLPPEHCSIVLGQLGYDVSRSETYRKYHGMQTKEKKRQMEEDDSSITNEYGHEQQIILEDFETFLDKEKEAFDQRISPLHVRIVYDEEAGRYYLADNDSIKGTFIVFTPQQIMNADPVSARDLVHGGNKDGPGRLVVTSDDLILYFGLESLWPFGSGAESSVMSFMFSNGKMTTEIPNNHHSMDKEALISIADSFEPVAVQKYSSDDFPVSSYSVKLSETGVIMPRETKNKCPVQCGTYHFYGNCRHTEIRITTYTPSDTFSRYYPRDVLDNGLRCPIGAPWIHPALNILHMPSMSREYKKYPLRGVGAVYKAHQTLSGTHTDISKYLSTLISHVSESQLVYRGHISNYCAESPSIESMFSSQFTYQNGLIKTTGTCYAPDGSKYVGQMSLQTNMRAFNPMHNKIFKIASGQALRVQDRNNRDPPACGICTGDCRKELGITRTCNQCMRKVSTDFYICDSHEFVINYCSQCYENGMLMPSTSTRPQPYDASTIASHTFQSGSGTSDWFRVPPNETIEVYRHPMLYLADTSFGTMPDVLEDKLIATLPALHHVDIVHVNNNGWAKIGRATLANSEVQYREHDITKEGYVKLFKVPLETPSDFKRYIKFVMMHILIEKPSDEGADNESSKGDKYGKDEDGDKQGEDRGSLMSSDDDISPGRVHEWIREGGVLKLTIGDKDWTLEEEKVREWCMKHQLDLSLLKGKKVSLSDPSAVPRAMQKMQHLYALEPMHQYGSFVKDGQGQVYDSEGVLIEQGQYQNDKFYSIKEQCIEDNLKDIDAEITAQEDRINAKKVEGHLYEEEAQKETQTELEKLNLQGYKYALIMHAAEKNLKHLLDSDYICGKDWVEIKSIGKHIADCLKHMHSKQFIHGDIKPLNICKMGVQGSYKLIDLDASIRYAPPEQAQYCGSKSSSAFAAPEMIVYDTNRQMYRVCDTGDRILATVSQDIWAFGCVMYNLCTGAPLFLSNDEDNLTSQKDLAILKNWNRDHLMEALDKDILDLDVRHFLSLLLAGDPKHRLPTMEHVLSQAFFTNKSPGRLAGAKTASFDVFLSYRVDSDLHMAQDLYHILTAKGLRVWWDRMSLADGVDWERGFCAGLISSRIFVPLLSHQGIQERFSQLAEDSRCDNVFLENRLALELQDRGLTEKIFPIFVGAKSTVRQQNFYDKYYPGAVSTKYVHSVERKVIDHLMETGLGLPLRHNMTVSKVKDEICKCNGGFVMSIDDKDKDKRIRPLGEILEDLAMRIRNLANEKN